MGADESRGRAERGVFLRAGKGKSAEITAILERRIRSGEYKAGTRIPGERELADEFAVSRNTVRDAKKALESRHLVETRWGAGTVVAGEDESAASMSAQLLRSRHEWSNVMELRGIVEPQIVALAASTVTDADLITLGGLIDRANPGMGPRESMDMDMAFHLAIAQSTGNPLIEALLGFVNDSTRKARLDTHETYEQRQLSITGHRRIFDCIRRGDANGAEEAMREHLRDIGHPAGEDSRSQ